MRSPIGGVIIFLFAVLILGGTGWAQDGARPTTGTLDQSPRTRLMRIGYLRPAGEGDFSRTEMESLRDRLQADPEVMRLARAAGYVSIGLYETDGGRDMLRRLEAREFDIAFAPSRVWAEQRSGYTVILQTRREEDFTLTRGRMVFRQGCVFISPRSPFFDDSPIDPNAFAQYLANSRLAVVNSESMAGFVGPLLALADEFDLNLPVGRYVYYQSSAEVAKAVIAGLVDVGICERESLERTIEAEDLGDSRNQLRRVVVQSAPIPTDPVVVHPDLAPAVSELGRELKRALRDFSLQGGLGSVSLQSAQDSDYLEVRELLRRFRALSTPAEERRQ